MEILIRKICRNIFFSGSINIDYSSAIKANISKQYYSVYPREWYVDATFICKDCNSEFDWSASEQKIWFEEYQFWIDSCPTHCVECRKEKRKLKMIRQEYNKLVAEAKSTNDIQLKKKVVDLIGILEESITLPKGIIETQTQLLKQIKKAEQLH